MTENFMQRLRERENHCGQCGMVTTWSVLAVALVLIALVVAIVSAI